MPALWSGYTFPFWLGQSTDLANAQRRSLKIHPKEELSSIENLQSTRTSVGWRWKMEDVDGDELEDTKEYVGTG